MAQKLALFCMSSLLISGCVSTPPPLGDRFKAAESPEPGMALVYFFRPYSETLKGNNVYLDVDGRVTAKLPVNAYTKLNLLPGRHAVKLTMEDGSMFGGNGLDKKTRVSGDIKVDSGGVYFIRYVATSYTQVSGLYRYTTDFSFYAVPVDEKGALSELQFQDCCSFSPPIFPSNPEQAKQGV